MAEEYPAECQHQTLPDRENGAIRRLLQHEESLEELVQRMGRIRQAEVQQGVGNQQVAEFVGNIRRGDRMVGQQQQPKRQRARAANSSMHQPVLCASL